MKYWALLLLLLLGSKAQAGDIILAWDDYHASAISGGGTDFHRYFQLFQKIDNGTFSVKALILDFNQNVSTTTVTGLDLTYSDYCYYLIAGDSLTPTYQNVAGYNQSILYVDSQELVAGNYAASWAVDGNLDTRFWHTIFSTQTPPGYPHELQIDLGSAYDLDTITYYPRSDGDSNGTIRGYSVYITNNTGNWGSVVSSGNLGQDTSIKNIVFTTTNGRYVKFVASSEINGGPWATAQEFQFRYQSGYVPNYGGNISGPSNTVCYYHTPPIITVPTVIMGITENIFIENENLSLTGITEEEYDRYLGNH